MAQGPSSLPTMIGSRMARMEKGAGMEALLISFGPLACPIQASVAH